MKKTSRNLFFLIAFLILLLGLIPRFLSLSGVQKKIETKISAYLGSTLQAERMYWVWLPLPNLTLRDATVAAGQYTLSTPRVAMYPSWNIIFGQKAKPGRIVMHNPRIFIDLKTVQQFKTDIKSDLAAGFFEVPFTVKDGTLEVKFTDDYKNILGTESLVFSNLNGSITLDQDKTEIDIIAATSFSKSIALQGTYQFDEKKYRFLLESPELKLHKSMKGFFNGRVMPVESTASLNGSISGKGLEQIEGDFHGTLPCFVVKPKDREVPLTCGYADLKFMKSGPQVRLDIENIEVEDPQVSLSGRIERNLSRRSDNEPPAEAPSIWTLDLAGRDLDLTAIRQKILTLWPDNNIARKVCNIVRGGRADSAAYRFHGSTADFKNLDAMVIEADPVDSDIYVPGAKLDLTGASGPILIKDSVLTGHNLKARLGNSFGTNADLFLDLAKNKHGFRLDIDIDADLDDLQPVLKRLVKHEGFQRELSKFSEISGRASGTLHLGDSLDRVITRVNVNKMALTGRYEPIPEKITIENGGLDIDPEQVQWHTLKGNMGSQEIHRTSGVVSWHSGNVLLNITEASAQLDGGSFLTLLQQTKVMPPQVGNILSSLEGSVEVTRGSLIGTPSDPRAWEYDFGLQAEQTTLTTPLLPEPVYAEHLEASINNTAADIRQAAVDYLGQPLKLKGHIQHQYLENWHGMVEFNGPVMNELADWIKTKGWLPEKLRPHIPCTVKNLKISWGGNSIGVSGNILQGLDGGRLPMAKINIENEPEHFQIHELSFYAPGERGSLKLDFWRRSPRKLVLVWNGFVSADTVDSLFEFSQLTAGTFSGDFEIQYFADQPEKTRFTGLLKTENLLLKNQRNEKPIIISNLDIAGTGNQLTVPTLQVAVGSEKITGSGQLMAGKEALQLDMNFNSSFISKLSLDSLSQTLQELRHTFFSPEEQPSQIEFANSRNFTGRVGFNFDTFTLNRVTNIPYDTPRSVSYSFYHIQGDMQFTPDNISRTEIFSSRLCGLGFRGVWFSDPGLGQKLHLSTEKGQTLRLENVLPCLGVQQDIIEGEFSLQADLLKESNSWYGGSIYLKSSTGRILRLKTLSRVFKVVNITDLFTEQVQAAGKRGYPYSRIDLDSHIKDNTLIIDRAIILGEGINLFARGEIGLADYEADLSLLIAPFKTFDTIISKVPILGEPVMGEYGSRVNIPVAIKGPIADPTVTPLHPEAVGKAFLDLAKDAFMLPYNIILKPLELTGEKESSTPSSEK